MAPTTAAPTSARLGALLSAPAAGNAQTAFESGNSLLETVSNKPDSNAAAVVPGAATSLLETVAGATTARGRRAVAARDTTSSASGTSSAAGRAEGKQVGGFSISGAVGGGEVGEGGGEGEGEAAEEALDEERLIQEEQEEQAEQADADTLSAAEKAEATSNLMAGFGADTTYTTTGRPGRDPGPDGGLVVNRNPPSPGPPTKADASEYDQWMVDDSTVTTSTSTTSTYVEDAELPGEREMNEENLACSLFSSLDEQICNEIGRGELMIKGHKHLHCGFKEAGDKISCVRCHDRKCQKEEGGKTYAYLRRFFIKIRCILLKEFWSGRRVGHDHLPLEGWVRELFHTKTVAAGGRPRV